MRLQPYKQMSLKQINTNNKLAPKYYGPYKVLQKIGSMDYKLELPSSSRVHPIFHVSCLKKVIGDNIQFKISCQSLMKKENSYWNLNKSLKQGPKNYEIMLLLITSSSGIT